MKNMIMELPKGEFIILPWNNDFENGYYIAEINDVKTIVKFREYTEEPVNCTDIKILNVIQLGKSKMQSLFKTNKVISYNFLLDDDGKLLYTYQVIQLIDALFEMVVNGRVYSYLSDFKSYGFNPAEPSSHTHINVRIGDDLVPVCDNSYYLLNNDIHEHFEELNIHEYKNIINKRIDNIEIVKEHSFDEDVPEYRIDEYLMEGTRYNDIIELFNKMLADDEYALVSGSSDHLKTFETIDELFEILEKSNVKNIPNREEISISSACTFNILKVKNTEIVSEMEFKNIDIYGNGYCVISISTYKDDVRNIKNYTYLLNNINNDIFEILPDYGEYVRPYSQMFGNGSRYFEVISKDADNYEEDAYIDYTRLL